jgi:hypothetical protein
MREKLRLRLKEKKVSDRIFTTFTRYDGSVVEKKIGYDAWSPPPPLWPDFSAVITKIFFKFY